MLWLLWTWKSWRNTAEPASSKAPLDAHENGAASIKVLLKTVSPLEKHTFNQKSPLFLFLLSLLIYFFIPIPKLVFVFSSTSNPKFWHQCYFWATSPLQAARLSIFWKMQAASLLATEEATELKASPDRIQGVFTVMKFFSKSCCFFGALCSDYFSIRSSTSPEYICSDYRAEPKCLGRIC